ncbi:MAG: BON domain-containing protein [Isosphaeraceae bacterium]|nr:BON domain-containing protein [Isosphaeraceae bacterium]
MRGLKRISTVLGILAAFAGQALAQNANQATANAVAKAIKTDATLAGYRIEIEAQDGLVTLSGGVASTQAKTQAVLVAGKVAGVNGVVDKMTVVGDARVRPAQYQMAMGGGRFLGHGGHAGAVGGGAIDGGMVGAPVGGDVMMNDGGPMPEGPAGAPGATQASNPNLPNYAWPSYAPYPNYSAVGYPTAYPWQAWPNIGPFYPYPEVPLDWRAVTLRWDDGIWWLDFKKHYTRPFFTPYPFGLFAY